MKVARLYTHTRLLAAASILAVAAFAFAGEHPDKCLSSHMHDAHFGLPPEGGMPPGGPEAMMPPLPPFLHAVKLTDAQEDEIFNLMHQQGPTVFEKSRVAHKAGEELRHMAESGKFDPSRARALADTLSSATTDLILLRTETESRVFALLTPAQRQQIKGRNEERHHSKAL
jgi:protein CpxP